jgi:hypothetical protein
VVVKEKQVYHKTHRELPVAEKKSGKGATRPAKTIENEENEIERWKVSFHQSSSKHTSSNVKKKAGKDEPISQKKTNKSLEMQLGRLRENGQMKNEPKSTPDAA